MQDTSQTKAYGARANGDKQTRTSTASERLTADIRSRIPQDFARVIDFHGHLCPGVTIGYLAAHATMQLLNVDSAIDEELAGIVETDACGVDAFQMLTGCTLGKGNLFFRDYGKQAFTLARRADGVGARFALLPNALGFDEDHQELRRRVLAGEASPGERSAFTQRHKTIAVDLLERPLDEVATVTAVTVDVPRPARVFDSTQCAVCGEAVMEPRVRLRDGQPVCIPCSTEYAPHWRPAN